MRKKLAFLSTVLAASFMATSANAAEIMIDPSAPAGEFNNNNVNCATTSPCTFTDVGTFVTPAGFNVVSLAIISTNVSALTDVDFTSVLFNGVEFVLNRQEPTDFGSLANQALVAGATNTLVVNGVSGGRGSYGGNLSFGSVAAVPEPAAWMLMLLGMAGIGYSMRRKDKPTLRVRYT